jgi:hypothetical protein
MVPLTFAAAAGYRALAQSSAAPGHVILLATIKLKPGREQQAPDPTYVFYEEWQDQASSAAHGK